MGIIQRQGIKNSIVSYLGVLIGAFSILFIYTREDAKEIYGYSIFLTGMADFLIPFASAGVSTLVVKFFPKFKEQNGGDRGFLMLLLGLYTFSFSVFLFLVYMFSDSFFQLLITARIDSQMILESNIHIVLPISFLSGLILILMHHCSNHMRIVVPEIIRSLGYKIWLPLLIVAFVSARVSQEMFAYFLLLFYLLASIMLLIYAFVIGSVDIRKPDANIVRTNKKTMATYAFFSGLNSIGAQLAFRIDAIMISLLLDYKSTGLYFILLFMASVIEKPTSAIIKIASPIISKAWEEKDKKEIDMIYKKSSINLLIVGIPVFLMIAFGLHDLDVISSGSKNFFDGRYIFLLLGLAKLFDMGTSVNSQIIFYSDKYKCSLLFILILGMLNVVLNYYFITTYGLIGAAMATFFALVCFNLMKLIFIQISFDLQPFTSKTVMLLVLSIPVVAVLYWIPSFANPFLNIIKNGLLVLVLYCPLVYLSKVSPDLNSLIKTTLSKSFRH